MKHLHFGFALVFASLGTSDAITLDTVLQRTVERNPEIQKAKCDLEAASGRRLVFHSVTWADTIIGAAGGLQGGHRAGDKEIQPFGFGYGGLTQPLFLASIPASRRRGDVEVLIAEQQLNVAVVQQLHTARIAFYTALFNRSLASLREEQRARLDENTTGQKNRYEAGLGPRGAFVSAEVQMTEVGPRIGSARRAYGAALLTLAQAMGDELNDDAKLPNPEGALTYAEIDVDLAQANATALETRPDLKLARLLVRSAAEDQRIIEAAYYPAINATVSGNLIPVSGIRRESEGSPRRSDDVISSELRNGAAYTWRVIDNGQTGGAVAKRRAIREINEQLLRKMEADVPRDLSRIQNDIEAIAIKEKALREASTAARENQTTLQENLAGGVASQLEFRLAENDLLDVQTGVLALAYGQKVALAEWDRATGKYLHFLDDSARKVQ